MIYFKIYRLRSLKIALFLIIIISFLIVCLTWHNTNRVLETSARAVMNATIVIDAGHGGEDPGAISNGIWEKKLTLFVSKRLKRILTQAGAKAYLTRKRDVDLGGNNPDINVRVKEDLNKRIGLAHKVKANVFLSIHANSFPGADSRGAQIFYQPGQKESKKLAEAIQTEMVRLLQNTEREAMSADIYTNRLSKMPSVTVEIGFLSSPEEAALLKDPMYQEKVAFAIYSGIVRYFSGK